MLQLGVELKAAIEHLYTTKYTCIRANPWVKLWYPTILYYLAIPVINSSIIFFEIFYEENVFPMIRLVEIVMRELLGHPKGLNV